MVTITDCIKEMIKVKGIAAAPSELEDSLLGCLLVNDVAIVGIPDSYTAERPKAFIVLNQLPATQNEAKVADELVGYVSKRKARHKWIRDIEFLNVIPKSPGGKILRKELRKRSVTQRNFQSKL